MRTYPLETKFGTQQFWKRLPTLPEDEPWKTYLHFSFEITKDEMERLDIEGSINQHLSDYLKSKILPQSEEE